MTLLAARDLTIRYGDRIAVAGLSFDVAPGEIVGLIGESGSGKSTVGLAVIDLLPDEATREGGLWIEGTDAATLKTRDRERRRSGTVGMVFQEPMAALNPVMTIGAQVAEAVRAHRPINRRAAMTEAAALLTRVGLDPARIPPQRYPHQLSGGQQQRVVIAMAIAGDPRLLIADEPTTALDVPTQAKVIALLVDLVRERGMGLLLISHDLPLVGGVADRIVVLQDGALVEEGRTLDILTEPVAAYTRSLLAHARHAAYLRPNRLVEAPPLVEVRGLGRDIPARRALLRLSPSRPILTGVDLAIAPGEIVGIVGESGSGKTTLLRTILALDRPDRGLVLVDGTPLHTARGTRRRALQRMVQAVFQDPAGSFDPRQTVDRIVAEPLHLLDPAPDAVDCDRRVRDALTSVGLAPDDAARHPHQFSGGQRQRIAIARALILDPRLVILDEAVSALDAATRGDILALLVRLSVERGLAYLFVSHDLGVMRGLADRLVVLRAGRIVEQGPTAALLDAPAHPYTRELIAASPDLDRVIAGRRPQA
ncbi:dipeptide ABC transporter ATP-binding protein [Sphingomonas sp. M6A6_1c]